VQNIIEKNQFQLNSDEDSSGSEDDGHISELKISMNSPIGRFDTQLSITKGETSMRDDDFNTA
jgi:hypothetical protein